MLTGKKVRLRPTRRSDLPLFMKWFNDPDVVQYLAMYLPMYEMAEEKWIEGLAAGKLVHFVIEAIDSESPVPIGALGLELNNPKDRMGGFGIAIGEKEYWSKGYGTEAARLIIGYAFNQLNLHRISSSAIDFNERSIKLHQKIGFKEEGRQRKIDFKNGEYHDRIMFGILKEEWRG